jgi:transposase
MLCPQRRAALFAARAGRSLIADDMGLGKTIEAIAAVEIMARHLGGRMKSNDIKRLTDEAIDKLPLVADVNLAIKSNVAVIAVLQAQIGLLEKRLLESLRPRPEYPLLMSVPGIGQALATVILLETGPLDRFADVGNFASYARCVASARISNRKKKGEGNAKNGNKYLAWAFIEAANFARRFCPEARRSTTERRPTPTTSLPPRLWRTSWRAPATTS